MKNEYIHHAHLSRRNFLGGAAAFAAFAIAPRHLLGESGEEETKKPNSVIDGVHIGVITYNLRGVEGTAEGTLAALVKCGLSEVELMSGPVNNYVGISGGRRRGFGGRRDFGGRGTMGEGAPRRGNNRGETPDETPDATRQEMQTQQQEQVTTILDVPISKFEELKKMYNDAGVNIHIVKFDSVARETSEDVINKYFEATKALGAKAITMERSEAAAKKLAPFAEKHEIFVAFHNHTNNYPQLEPDDPILDYGKYIGFNFDTGHMYCGSDGKSPISIIEKYHDRIISLHLKDRTPQSQGGGNLPWGQGSTPIKEMLQLIRDEKWPIYCDIELEYRYQGSDAIAEVAKCLQYCKDALAT